jgi:hypothetical protein
MDNLIKILVVEDEMIIGAKISMQLTKSEPGLHSVPAGANPKSHTSRKT